jgi:phosphatidylserine synthase
LILAFAITAAAGALMVCRFSYSSFKSFGVARPMRFIWLVVVALVFIIIASHPPAVLLTIFGGYALWSPLVWLWRRIRRFRRVPAVTDSASGEAE